LYHQEKEIKMNEKQAAKTTEAGAKEVTKESKTVTPENQGISADTKEIESAAAKEKQKKLDEVDKLKEEIAATIEHGKDVVKDQLAELDKKFDEFKEKGGKIVDIAADSAGDAWEEALKELKEGYEKIKKII
jgi:hypothetical protein